MPTTVWGALGGATAGPVDEPGPVSEHANHTAGAATSKTTTAARISLRPAIIANPREPGVRARDDYGAAGSTRLVLREQVPGARCAKPRQLLLPHLPDLTNRLPRLHGAPQLGSSRQAIKARDTKLEFGGVRHTNGGQQGDGQPG